MAVQKRIRFVEDDYRTTEGFILKLEKLLGEEVVRCEPPRIDEGELPSERDTKLIIVDYDLTMRRSDDTLANYEGGTLVRALRDSLQGTPLVVVTRPEVLGVYSQVRTLGDTADLVLFKNEVDNAKYQLGRKILALIDGYEELAEHQTEEHGWDLLMEVLKASEPESRLLDEANPPIGPDNSPRPDVFDAGEESPEPDMPPFRGWTAHDASRWVIGTLFRYPGILYDYNYASTSLGIKPEFFGSKQIQDQLAGTQYDGVFCGFGDYWWRGRLKERAVSLMGGTGMKPVHEVFVPWFSKKLTLDIPPAKCNSSDEDYADTICYILQEPVKTAYSLPYYPDNRPLIMDPARVSFKAIRKSNRVKKRLLKKSDYELFDALRKGDG